MMTSAENFGVVIVCCSTPAQATYWQQRLEGGRGSLLPANAMVACVHEDWPGGAGNALGTLYAFQNAQALVTNKYGVDLLAKLQAGETSVGLFHTAGKGTRLAPLPGAENNNKPGVKLPAVVTVNGKQSPMTILEAVIKQTGCYARSRRGRLSVFWGDQIFIPTVSVEYKVTHHADILCRLGPMVDEAEWKEKGLQNYGLIAQGESGDAAQVEKVDHPTALKLLASFGPIRAVGASLGSFSVSASLLTCLLTEFSRELAAKTGKMDSDPHLWMPMTLAKDIYVSVMGTKGVNAEISSAHYDRIREMLTRFYKFEDNKALGTFGAVNVGQDCCWWDYGLLKLYQQNALLVTADTKDAALMRKFFGYGAQGVIDSVTTGTTVDRSSFVSSCSLLGGRVVKSVVSNVRCNDIQADGAILINVTANRIVAAPGSILYNVRDDSKEGLVLTAGVVKAGVVDSFGSQLVMSSKLSIDGGKAWDEKVEGNGKTFGEVYSSNESANPTELESTIRAQHDAAWATVRTDAMAEAKRAADAKSAADAKAAEATTAATPAMKTYSSKLCNFVSNPLFIYGMCIEDIMDVLHYNVAYVNTFIILF